jgi:hypothetical protein
MGYINRNGENKQKADACIVHIILANCLRRCEKTMEHFIKRKEGFMNWRKFYMLLCLLSVIATVPWGVNQGWGQQQVGNGNGTAPKNQLNEAANAAAAARKSKGGLMRTTTLDDKRAAAKRNAARQAAADQGKGRRP